MSAPRLKMASLPDYDPPAALTRTYSSDLQADEVAEKVPPWRKTFKQVLAAVVVDMLAFVFGTVLGWPAPAQPQLQSDHSPIGGAAVSTETMSWLAAVMCIGCLLGTFTFGWVQDRLGRKVAGLIGAVPFVVSWLAILLADEPAWLFVGRVLAGLAGGASLVVCPTYVGETVEDSLRGVLGALFSVSINVGILFAYVVGSLVSFHAYAGICLAMPCVFFACFLFLPDTPVYLLSRGRVPSAVRSLTWLRDGRADLVDDELTRLLSSVKEAGAGEERADRPRGGAVRELVGSRSGRRALLTVMALFLVQQFCGINAILSYTVEIFRESGSTLDPSAATIVVGALQLFGVILSAFLVDRAGRRILLMVSYGCMSLALFVLGGCFYMKANKQDISHVDWLPVLCLSLYSVAYALGAGPVPFIMVSEVFTSAVRSLATSLSIAFTSVLAFITMKFYGDLCASIGVYGSMWAFGTVSALGVAFVWWCVLETKGKSLDVILSELDGRPAPSSKRSPSAGPLFIPSQADVFYTQAEMNQDETVT